MKYWILITGIILIITLTVFKLFINIDFYSDTILAVTAIIILIYTYETSKIREANATIASANKELLRRDKSPFVGYKIYTNPDNNLDTRFLLKNNSNYPLSARTNCNIKINEEPLQNYSSAYNGKEYWNLQYGQAKEGHFSWLDLFKAHNLIDAVERKRIMDEHPNTRQALVEGYFFRRFDNKIPNLTMDVEIYCETELGLNSYYPPVHYDYDFKRKVWVPILTSPIPHWEYLKKPDWIS